MAIEITIALKTIPTSDLTILSLNRLTSIPFFGLEKNTKNALTAIHINAAGRMIEKRRDEITSATHRYFDSLFDSRESVNKIAEVQNKAAAAISIANGLITAEKELTAGVSNRRIDTQALRD